ncbi:unnamed protein product [Larinioides sclopetarius]|uniref:Cyclic nucleotide-binding domain-containing protein n=2 Tax=Larinioides sclopetarius TaxID=280406 RepID=A0AAV2B219_9ARAC
MVEGSPRRVAVSSHDANIKIPLELAEEEEKNNLRYRQHESVHKTESDPSSPGGSRWKKLRTTVQLGNAVTHHRKPPLKREDSFLKRFSTRPPNIILCDKDPNKADNWFYRVVRASVLNPDESLLFWWLWMVTFCGLYNSWTLIAREAFPELQEAHVVLWDVLDWCSDVVYLLDIAVQFRTGYLEQGIMVRDSAQLAKHYVTSRDFFLDVVALAPLSYLHGMVGESPLLRFPRFLKARRIYKFYYAVESRTAYPNLWRVANLIHVLLLLAHWFGCFYYMLSELEGFKGNWAYKHPDSQEHSPLVRKYLGSVYWSTLTLTTIGDLATPATNLQYMFTIISYLIGVFIFATIVGQVGNVITNRNASRLEFERLLDGAKLYMRHHKVPKGMQRRVQRWYDYSWSRGRMQGGGDIHSALGILPDKLKTELAIHVNLKTLKKVSIFKECQPEFLHDLVLKMKAYIFTPGDLVCRKGEVAREMFIIADGILQVINDKGQVLTHMRAGDFFGEIGILNLDGFNRRTADVRSVGYSELFSLSREDVLSAMKDYPEAEEILQTMGRRRLLEARLTNASDKVPYQDDPEGKKENRQRKKGISLAYLLRKKDTQYDVANFHKQKFSTASSKSVDTQSISCSESTKIEVHQNSLIHFNHVELKPSNSDSKSSSDDNAAINPRVSCLVEQITSKFRKRNKIPQFRIRRKHSWWYKISSLVHLRRKSVTTTTSTRHSEVPDDCEDAKSTKNIKSCDVLLKPEDLRLQNTVRPVQGPQKEVDGRRTSWQPSKPSVSNWTRSELFTHSAEAAIAKQTKNRRKTLADGMLLSSNIAQNKPYTSHEKVPGILMTGSDLNAPDDSSDVSPMSSNYSLTPSTTENDEDIEDDEDDGGVKEEKDRKESSSVPPEIDKTIEGPDLPPELKSIIFNIVMGIKDKVDEIILQSEKKTIDEIVMLKERIKQQDALIEYLEMRCAQELGDESLKTEDVREERQPPSPVEKSSPPNKPSEDSAVSSIDVPSPVDFMSDVKFEEEDMWLVEFPPNLPVAAKPAEKRSRLRRHSSVEVGHEIPFRLAAQKPPTEKFLHPTMYGDQQISPRRFSESQARPDVVPLNKSFAAKVRRVLAKVRVSRDSDDQSSSETSSPQSSYKWPQVTTKTEDKKTRRSSTGSTNLSSLFQPKSTANSKRFQTSSSESEENSNRRYGSDGNPIVKRILPTITESSSFDSLRDSPLMPHTATQPVISMPNLDGENLTVVIDMTDATQDES